MGKSAKFSRFGRSKKERDHIKILKNSVASKTLYNAAPTPEKVTTTTVTDSTLRPAIVSRGKRTSASVADGAKAGAANHDAVLHSTRKSPTAPNKSKRPGPRGKIGKQAPNVIVKKVARRVKF